jgi:hypothetical protein
LILFFSFVVPSKCLLIYHYKCRLEIKKKMDKSFAI